MAALAFASLRVNGLLPLLIPVEILLLVPYVREATTATRHVWPRGRTIVDALYISAGVLVLASPASAGCIRVSGPWLPDTDAVRALAAAHPKGRMATWFDWGEYAIWHFGPALKVSIDGRRETVYSEEELQRQVAIAFGETAGLEELARLSPEYVWVPTLNSERTRGWLKGHDYRMDVETPRSFVAVRADLPKIAAVPGTSTRCFPGL